MKRVVAMVLGGGVLLASCSAGATEVAIRSPEPQRAAEPEVATIAAAPAPGAPFAAADRYDITAEYDEKTRRLAGVETITFTNDGDTTMTTLRLRLWPNGQTTCARPFVTVGDVQGATPGTLQVGCTTLPLTLDDPVPPGGQGEVTLEFADKLAPAWNFRYGKSGEGLMFGNAFPIVAPTAASANHEYTLQGEAMYSTVAQWDVDLTIPKGDKAATTGIVQQQEKLGDGRTRLQLHSPNERDFAIAIGPFRVYETTAKGIQIRYFRQPQGVKDADVRPATILRWAREAVNDFTEHYGPYDQPQFDMVGTTWGAMGSEWPSMLMVGINRDVVIHEVGHLWWYSMVGNDQWSAPWTDESFAEFVTRRLKGTASKCDDEDPFAGRGGTQRLHASMGDFDDGGNYTDTIYRAGPCALERLRRDWGDAAFDAFMSGLIADHRDGEVDTCTVIDAMGAAAPPGYDVTDFLTDARLDTAPC